MNIYVKPAKKASVTNAKWIVIDNVCEVYVANAADEKDNQVGVSSSENLLSRIKQTKLVQTGEKKTTYLISIIDIVTAIEQSFPGHQISNLGEMDSIVEYMPIHKKENFIWKYSKVVFVALVLFLGAATAIMSFHSDAQMPNVFIKFHEIFFGTTNTDPWIIELPYSIGLAVGIVVFFNHFAGRKLTDDPTPIEVEMTLYDADVTCTMVDLLNAKRQNNNDKPKNKGS